MPVRRCQSDGKPGFKWGDSGKCYTYTEGDQASRDRARAAAERQGRAAIANMTPRERIREGLRSAR